MDTKNNSIQSHAFLVKTLKAEYLLIEVNDVVYCKADGSYTNLYLENDKAVVITRSLIYIEKLLGKSNFVRCHRSYLINIEKAKRFDINNRIITVLEHEIPVSRRRCCEVLKEFKFRSNKL